MIISNFGLIPPHRAIIKMQATGLPMSFTLGPGLHGRDIDVFFSRLEGCIVSGHIKPKSDKVTLQISDKNYLPIITEALERCSMLTKRVSFDIVQKEVSR